MTISTWISRIPRLQWVEFVKQPPLRAAIHAALFEVPPYQCAVFIALFAYAQFLADFLLPARNFPERAPVISFVPIE